MSDAPQNAPLYAVSAAFGSPEAALAAACALGQRRLGRVDVLSPVPIDGLVEGLGMPAPAIPAYIAIGFATLGFAAMMGMCVYATAVDYKFDIGGRPLVSWPAFIVPSVSFAMLTGALAVFFNMLFMNRLPRLNHPAFNIPGFGKSTQDRFFVTIEPGAEHASAETIEALLAALATRPFAVARVPR